jgi:hypothetical protein
MLCLRGAGVALVPAKEGPAIFRLSRGSKTAGETPASPFVVSFKNIADI